jgi:type II secretion system protein H
LPEVNRNTGFTLIELMVVLIIITLLSTMVIPSAVSAVRRNTIQTEGGKLTELLRFAYVSAIARQRPIQVNLDSRRGLCWVSVSDSALPWIEERQEATTQTLATLPIRDELQLSVIFGEEGTGTAGSSQDWQVLTFRSDGRADSVIIALTNSRGETYAVEVFGATGEVNVREREF